MLLSPFDFCLICLVSFFLTFLLFFVVFVTLMINIMLVLHVTVQALETIYIEMAMGRIGPLIIKIIWNNICVLSLDLVELFASISSYHFLDFLFKIFPVRWM